MKKIFTLSCILTLTIFSLRAQTPQFPNPSFEVWDGTGANIEPTSYNSNKSGKGYAPSGPQTCFKDGTTFHTGAFSARLETVYFIIATVNGSLTSGIVCAPSTNKLEGYIGTIENTILTDCRRISFNGRPDSLVGWYKYTQSTMTTGTGGANEIGKVIAILHKGNYYDPGTPVASNHPDSTVNKIGQALFLTAAANTSTWTRFAVPFSYVSAAAPAYILMSATPSNNQNTSVYGSKLWLDDIAVVYNTTGVQEQAKEEAVHVFSFDNILHVDFSVGKEKASTLNVYDVTGKLVHSQSVNGSTLISLTDLKAGMYFYQIEGKELSKSGKFYIE